VVNESKKLSNIMSGFPKRALPLRLSDKMLNVFLDSHMYAVCSDHLILHLITIKTLYEKHKLEDHCVIFSSLLLLIFLMASSVVQIF
jgi:hypothetical protein